MSDEKIIHKSNYVIGALIGIFGLLCAPSAFVLAMLGSWWADGRFWAMALICLFAFPPACLFGQALMESARNQ